ncbi:hypothetical protein QEH59_15920 [Coraliomargarita sp. SDUM461004]|uniref:VanZ-like domain-containing protein n=1 Tax=Thalassobacterium sedimentorum TaxID=3041258 RepID=A0ABU1AMJ1_9BACT|nr:hypothetical protein [Coraliomargarita sp. SDUM461004]MDQ8195922.1 hypothetical protein [Coraliomargarita sp. SDUM461004]
MKSLCNLGRYWLVLQFVALSVLFGLIIYLSLRSSPSMGELAWLPGPIADWADRNGDLRTLVPYALAATLWCWCLRCYYLHKPAVQMASEVRLCCGYLLGGFVLLVLLLGTELWQVFLPERHPALGDLFWGSVGIVGGLAVGGWRWSRLTKF